jgi:hypothetical protein
VETRGAWPQTVRGSEVAVKLDHSAPPPPKLSGSKSYSSTAVYTYLSVRHGYSTEAKPLSPAASPSTVDSLDLAG